MPPELDRKCGFTLRALDSGSGYCSQSVLPVHFGLPEDGRLDVEVTALTKVGRKITRVANVDPNKLARRARGETPEGIGNETRLLGFNVATGEAVAPAMLTVCPSFSYRVLVQTQSRR
jgi:hypothetical protein